MYCIYCGKELAGDKCVCEECAKKQGGIDISDGKKDGANGNVNAGIAGGQGAQGGNQNQKRSAHITSLVTGAVGFAIFFSFAIMFMCSAFMSDLKTISFFLMLTSLPLAGVALGFGIKSAIAFKKQKRSGTANASTLVMGCVGLALSALTVFGVAVTISYAIAAGIYSLIIAFFLTILGGFGGSAVI